MSFHRKTFLVWLTTMSLFVAGMSAVATYMGPAELQGDAMDQLIEAARAHAKDLRKRAADVEAAERWERLATAAQIELRCYGSPRDEPRLMTAVPSPVEAGTVGGPRHSARQLIPR